MDEKQINYNGVDLTIKGYYDKVEDQFHIEGVYVEDVNITNVIHTDFYYEIIDIIDGKDL